MRFYFFVFAGKANRAYQSYQHRGDSSDGECDEDTAEFQPNNRHQHSLQHQYHRHRRPNHTYQQPGALLNTDTSGTSGNCSDATLTDSELAFTRDATLQLHDGELHYTPLIYIYFFLNRKWIWLFKIYNRIDVEKYRNVERKKFF